MGHRVLELAGEALGLERPDLFRHWKMMQDVDRVLAEQPLPLGQPATRT